MKLFNNISEFKQLLPKPDVFLDCGVGVPKSEAWEIHKIWPKTQIFGFEPHPSRFNTCKDNGFPGNLFQYAIGANDSNIIMQNIDGMAVNFPRDYQVSSDKVNVRMRSLDSFDNEHGPFNNVMIWADIEGAELEMLKGVVELLKSGRVVSLYLELWHKYQVKNWCLRDEVIEFLDQFGFNPQYATKEIITGQSKTHGDYIFLRS